MLDAAAENCDSDLYEQHNPKASQYYRCAEAHFEQLEIAWDDRYARMYGFWRLYVSQVIYTSKDGKTSKTFDALDWPAQLVTHIPNRGEQMVR